MVAGSTSEAALVSIVPTGLLSFVNCLNDMLSRSVNIAKETWKGVQSTRNVCNPAEIVLSTILKAVY